MPANSQVKGCCVRHKACQQLVKQVNRDNSTHRPAAGGRGWEHRYAILALLVLLQVSRSNSTAPACTGLPQAGASGSGRGWEHPFALLALLVLYFTAENVECLRRYARQRERLGTPLRFTCFTSTTALYTECLRRYVRQRERLGTPLREVLHQVHEVQRVRCPLLGRMSAASKACQQLVKHVSSMSAASKACQQLVKHVSS